METIANCFTGIKQELVDNSENLERNIILPAANVLNDTFFQHATHQYDSSDASSTKSRIVNESPEARARRLARNAERMRIKRANESYDEYKIRLAKNAEANRRKRQMENDMERAMRQVKDAARQRLRRAMESTDQRTIRLAKLAERMRMVRANESQDQRAERLKRSAARARERLSRESSEERRDRLQKRAEYARKMRAITSSGSDSSTLERTESQDANPSSRPILQRTPTPSEINHQNSQNHTLDGHQQQHQQPTAPSQAHQVNMNNLHDFPPHSQNLVTLNNVKPESQFNQFALNQNPLFLNFRPENYLNVPSYHNVFPDSLPSQVPPHLQNYVQSLSLPLHPSQLISNPSCFPNHLEHPSHHPASVIQPNPSQNFNSGPFLGQHPSPFQPQPPNIHHHNIPQPPPSNHNNAHQQNYSHQQNSQSPASTNQRQQPLRIPSPEDSSSNDSEKERIRDRQRKVFPLDDHGNPRAPEEMKDVDVDRQKVMSELLEEQISIILSSPKRHRGRPSKGRETDKERTERLRKMAESRRIKRANETPEERQRRLQVLTDRARHRREIIKATETEEERKIRLARQAEYARMRRVREQAPDAKHKADQRAKDLYAKIHVNQINSEHSPAQQSIPQPPTSSTMYDGPVNLRIPNPAQRHLGNYNSGGTHSENSDRTNNINRNSSSHSPDSETPSTDSDHKKIRANMQSHLFEPIVELQTI